MPLRQNFVVTLAKYDPDIIRSFLAMLSIEVTEAALREIQRMKLTCEKPDSYLRLRVNPGGCSGLFYGMELEKPSQSTEDNYLEIKGTQIVVDSQSLSYLQGIKLDYAEDLMGGGFRFQNPNVTGTCNCGISFSSAIDPEQEN